MSKLVCKYCGLGPATYAEKGPHLGEWCSFCKRWIRWVPKHTTNTTNISHEPIPNIINDKPMNYDDEEVPF